jgi:hypothetical protein
MTVLGDTLIVVGEHNCVVIHRLPDFYFIDFGMGIDGRIRDLNTMDNQLLVLSSGPFVYYGDQSIHIACDWRSTRCICVTPHGFVVSANEPTDQPVDWRERTPGILLFYEHGVYVRTIHTYYAWCSMTWVGKGNIAFATTRLLNGVAEIYLLSIDGIIIDTIVHHLPNELIGISIIYDPKWEEYIVSGGKRIIGFTHVHGTINVREIYSYNGSDAPYLHFMVLHGRTLFVCIRNKSSILRLELN